jgi:Right handed beta helix region
MRLALPVVAEGQKGRLRSVVGTASIRCAQTTAVAALSLCALLVAPIASAKPPAGDGTVLRGNHKQLAEKALAALGSSEGSDPVIVFGLPKPLRAGTRITVAGAKKRAPPVSKVGGDGAFFFYEDAELFQLSQHPGRVALVDAKSGRVKIAKATTWPLVNGKLPAFLTSPKRYRSSKYRVFYRSTAPVSEADGPLFENDPFGDGGGFAAPIAGESKTAEGSFSFVASSVPPAVTTSPGCTAYTEKAAAVVVDGQVTVSDPDDANLDSARVRISASFQGGDDILFTDQNGISGSYDDETGVLFLTGTTSVANYAAALRSVSYRNLASGNASVIKDVEFTVNDGDGDSAPSTKRICITTVNEPPIGEAGEGVLEYTENDGPVPLDGAFVVGDPDSDNIAGATIKFVPVVSQPVDENGDPVGPPVSTVTFAPSEDDLAFVNQNGITGSYADQTGVLTLSGTAPLAAYEAAIRSVTYENSSADASDLQRRLEFQVTDSSAARSIPSRRDIFITRAATTYYVSPTGSDANVGTSQATAWRTVNKVNNAALNPGDVVLFQGGATFSDTYLGPSRSGTASSPIVYGSYGSGKASLPEGIYLISVSGLKFEDLSISRAGVGAGVHGAPGGTGTSNITIDGLSISNVNQGIMTAEHDTNWTIRDNTISQTDDSGMILYGSNISVTGNQIIDTGNDGTEFNYGRHGIYLTATGASVTGNTIQEFEGSGVSARMRNSVIDNNVISGGPVGISWFQDDPNAGTSYWRNNTISDTTSAGIYVDDVNGRAPPTRESFVITGNAITSTSGVCMNLKPTSGTYTLQPPPNTCNGDVF